MKKLIPIALLVIFTFGFAEYSPYIKRLLGEETELTLVQKVLHYTEETYYMFPIKSFSTYTMSYNLDCSGFVCYIFDKAGVTLIDKLKGGGNNLAKGMYYGLDARGHCFLYQKPEPGDIVFFDNTADMNTNRIWDDELTHVGIVTSVASDGTVTYVHMVHGEIKQGFMNLNYPLRFGVNSQIRANMVYGGYAKDYLSSACFRGFARVGADMREKRLAQYRETSEHFYFDDDDYDDETDDDALEIPEEWGMVTIY